MFITHYETLKGWYNKPKKKKRQKKAKNKDNAIN